MEAQQATMEQIARDNEEFLAEMRDAHGAPVYDDDGMAVFADEGAGEYDAIADHYEGVTVEDISEWSHEIARDACDYDWSVTYPVIVFKSEAPAEDGR